MKRAVNFFASHSPCRVSEPVITFLFAEGKNRLADETLLRLPWPPQSLRLSYSTVNYFTTLHCSGKTPTLIMQHRYGTLTSIKIFVRWRRCKNLLRVCTKDYNKLAGSFSNTITSGWKVNLSFVYVL